MDTVAAADSVATGEESMLVPEEGDTPDSGGATDDSGGPSEMLESKTTLGGDENTKEVVENKNGGNTPGTGLDLGYYRRMEAEANGESADSNEQGD